jgi:DNA-binding CsgD family transcriptional regulator
MSYLAAHSRIVIFLLLALLALPSVSLAAPRETVYERLMRKYLPNGDFTPRQIEVIALIREGKTTKEIAQLLAVGEDAIDMQRLLIRKKLGINNKKTNLQSYLLSLT